MSFVERPGSIKIKQRTQFGCAGSIDCIPLFYCFIDNVTMRCHRVRLTQLLCVQSVSISLKILIGPDSIIIIAMSLLFYAPSAEQFDSALFVARVCVSHSCKWLSMRDTMFLKEEPPRAKSRPFDSPHNVHNAQGWEKITCHKVI